MFDFHPLEMADLPLLVGWFNAPHAVRWFGDRRTPEDIRSEYGDSISGRDRMRPFVVSLDGRPIGMCEWTLFGEHPDVKEAYGVDDPNAANCDILIGEAHAAHRGLGATLVREFVARVVFADPRPTTCIIDPETENAIAIRAYEKAGFRFIRAAADDLEGKSVYLMELKRSELDAAPEAPPFTIRPLRENELEIAAAIDVDASAVERERWRAATLAGHALMADSPGGEPVGFAAFDFVGGVPCLHQVSVRRAWTRKGIGGALVERALRWSVRPGELWLTTYEHVPWNAPLWERRGFVRARDEECPAAILDLKRQIVMVYRHRKNLFTSSLKAVKNPRPENPTRP